MIVHVITGVADNNGSIFTAVGRTFSDAVDAVLDECGFDNQDERLEADMALQDLEPDSVSKPLNAYLAYSLDIRYSVREV